MTDGGAQPGERWFQFHEEAFRLKRLWDRRQAFATWALWLFAWGAMLSRGVRLTAWQLLVVPSITLLAVQVMGFVCGVLFGFERRRLRRKYPEVFGE